MNTYIYLHVMSIKHMETAWNQVGIKRACRRNGSEHDLARCVTCEMAESRRVGRSSMSISIRFRCPGAVSE